MTSLILLFFFFIFDTITFAMHLRLLDLWVDFFIKKPYLNWLVLCSNCMLFDFVVKNKKIQSLFNYNLSFRYFKRIHENLAEIHKKLETSKRRFFLYLFIMINGLLLFFVVVETSWNCVDILLKQVQHNFDEVDPWKRGTW